MTDYEHHIFVSYRRSDDDWVRWTRDNFVRALRSLLQPRLSRVKIYTDERIETGSTWPHDLAQNHSRSRLLVALLSRDYFESDWCCLELALMHRRERLAKLRTADNTGGLIIPVVIDDGDCFPEAIKAMQPLPLHDFANPFMRSDSPKQEALAELLHERLCPAIEHALGIVPKFDPAWERIAHKKFVKVFRIQSKSQITMPKLKLILR